MKHLIRVFRRAALSRGGILGVGLLVALAGLAVYIRSQQDCRPLPALTSPIEDPEVARVIDQARTAVQESPCSSEAWGQLGMLWAAHDYFAEASVCFDEAERLDSREPRWPYFHAAVLRPVDQRSALPFLERAVALFGTTHDAPQLTLAETLLDLGRLDEAEQHFEQVRQRSPGDERCLFGLGRLAIERGDPTDALSYLQTTVNSPHAGRASHTLRANVYRRLGDAAAAERELAQVAGLPEDAPWPDPLLQEYQSLKVGTLARLSDVSRLYGRKNVADAVAILQQMIRDDPRSERGWFLLGQIHIHLGDLAYAEQCLKTAVQCAPDSADAYFLLGVALQRQNKLESAARIFRRLIELKPNDGTAYNALGVCLRQLDDDGALAAFEQAVLAKPDLLAAHVSLVELYAESGRMSEATEHLEYAMSLSPDNPQVLLLKERLLVP